MAINPKQKITAVLLVIIALIVVFSIVSSTSDDLTDAGHSVDKANSCNRNKDSTGVTLVFNNTDSLCYNTTGVDTKLGSTLTTLPLNNLFAANGIVFLILMAGVLLMIIMMVLKKLRSSS